MNIKSKSSIKIKYSNKFLPSTLKLTSTVIDSLMKIERQSRNNNDYQEYEPLPRKMHKGETPIGNCS